jgi:hypothetical protein
MHAKQRKQQQQQQQCMQCKFGNAGVCLPSPYLQLPQDTTIRLQFSALCFFVRRHRVGCGSMAQPSSMQR